MRGGIECSRCGCTDLRVVETRRNRGGKILRGKVFRRRICRNCGKETRTMEQEIDDDRGER